MEQDLTKITPGAFKQSLFAVGLCKLHEIRVTTKNKNGL